MCLFLTLHYGQGHGVSVHEWKNTQCMRACDHKDSLITFAPSQISPLSSFLHIDLLHLFMSSATLHTSLVGSIIKDSQISPHRTQRGILLISISQTGLPQALHNENSRARIKCLRFTVNLTFNCELIIQPCAGCSVLNDQRPS